MLDDEFSPAYIVLRVDGRSVRVRLAVVGILAAATVLAAVGVFAVQVGWL